MEFSSALLEKAVQELAQLPGIGRRTAARLALHLLKQPEHQSVQLAEALVQLRQLSTYCTQCHALADTPICHICAQPSRDTATLCVVEDIRDVMALENTRQYKGLYHVLGGRISPMEGVGPGDLHIESLMMRLRQGQFKELIFALSATIDADTTQFFISRQMADLPIEVSTLARGIAVGDELEYADELTLGRSLLQRVKVDPL